MSDNKKVKDVAGEGKGLGAYYKGKAKDYKMIIPIDPPKPVKKAMLGMLIAKKAKDKGASGPEYLSPAAMLMRALKKQGGEIKGGQKKLDMNKDGKISGEDFKMMKKSGGGLIRGTGAAVKGTKFKGVF